LVKVFCLVFNSAVLADTQQYVFDSSCEGRSESAKIYVKINDQGDILSFISEEYNNGKLGKVKQWTAQQLVDSNTKAIDLVVVKGPFGNSIPVIRLSSIDFIPTKGGNFKIYFRKSISSNWGSFDMEMSMPLQNWQIAQNSSAGRIPVTEIQFRQKKSGDGLCGANGLAEDKSWVTLANEGCK
jgi:hypothetical protein